MAILNSTIINGDLTVNESITQNDAVKNMLLDLVYPIGSIYMSVKNVSPATFLGGTWEAWGQGRVPVGVDTAQTEFDTVEETGGEKTHTLTEAELAEHSHKWKTYFLSAENTPETLYVYNKSGSKSGWCLTGTSDTAVYPQIVNTMATNPYSLSISATGSGTAHNNLQPYQTCYMWKRIE